MLGGLKKYAFKSFRATQNNPCESSASITASFFAFFSQHGLSAQASQLDEHTFQ
jgi:hypothetical protein